jgi:hypothetical protein
VINPKPFSGTMTVDATVGTVTAVNINAGALGIFTTVFNQFPSSGDWLVSILNTPTLGGIRAL